MVSRYGVAFVSGPNARRRSVPLGRRLEFAMSLTTSRLSARWRPFPSCLLEDISRFAYLSAFTHPNKRFRPTKSHSSLDDVLLVGRFSSLATTVRSLRVRQP